MSGLGRKRTLGGSVRFGWKADIGLQVSQHASGEEKDDKEKGAQRRESAPYGAQRKAAAQPIQLSLPKAVSQACQSGSAND